MNPMTDEPRKINCEEAVRMLFQYLDRELERPDRTAMEQHLQSCRSCYSHLEFEQRLRNLVRDGSVEAAPEDLRARIKKLTERF
jgi:anti-sigma factor (TIGR02949 family)